MIIRLRQMRELGSNAETVSALDRTKGHADDKWVSIICHQNFIESSLRSWTRYSTGYADDHDGCPRDLLFWKRLDAATVASDSM
jgi:hypothetical protein